MKNITIKPNVTVRQAMKKLSQLGEKCLIIINEKNILLGTLSDGDLRKAILNGVSINDSIENYYNMNPTSLVENKFDIEIAKKIFTEQKFDLIPIVDTNRKLINILSWKDAYGNESKRQKGYINLPVVIMAGGKGTRLEPFTKILPKPLVPIHEKPVIEHIIERFTDVGINEFILSVNYKARIMKAFFEELDHDYLIKFVEEEKPLGTAGSLKLLEAKINKPFMMTNCDIIIKTDYPDLYSFHEENNYEITLVASMKNYTIPYGTCELNSDGYLSNINEKPQYDFLINTGLYVLNPSVLKLIPKAKTYHITNLIEDVKKSGKKIGVYPIDDDAWIDVGEWAEYKKALNKL